jgi:NAD(P)-dependent dehydrogenase (short-subunit alcohol dehydrogenase family)
MTKDPRAREDDAEQLDPTAASAAPQDAGRRRLLTASVLGAAAAAVPSLLAGPAAASQAASGSGPERALAGKTAFITGGARGLGLAAAEELANAGADIVLYDVASGELPHVQYPIATERDLSAAKARIEALGVRCQTFTGDVRDRDRQAVAMAQAVEAFGSLDIVVANAGVSQVGSIEEFSSAEISTVFEINVAGVVKTTQAAVPFMKPQRSGRIVYIASALGRMGNELFPVYTASKWAVIGFAKSAALSYGRFNILCNTVAPGLAHTPLADNPYMLRRMAPDHPNPSFETISEMLKPGNPIPVGHVEPVDVARAVLLFASRATEKVTGEVFDVSYGSLARSIA